MSYESINPKIIESIRRYADQRVPTGGFLRAILTNDLRLAVGLADEDNLKELREIVQYCHWEIPGNCWGSSERVKAWINPPLGEQPDGTLRLEKVGA